MAKFNQRPVQNWYNVLGGVAIAFIGYMTQHDAAKSKERQYQYEQWNSNQHDATQLKADSLQKELNAIKK